MNAIKRNKRFIHSRHDIPFLNDRCCWCGSLFDQHAPHQQAQSDIAFCRKTLAKYEQYNHRQHRNRTHNPEHVGGLRFHTTANTEQTTLAHGVTGHETGVYADSDRGRSVHHQIENSYATTILLDRQRI